MTSATRASTLERAELARRKLDSAMSTLEIEVNLTKQANARALARGGLFRQVLHWLLGPLGMLERQLRRLSVPAGVGKLWSQRRDLIHHNCAEMPTHAAATERRTRSNDV